MHFQPDRQDFSSQLNALQLRIDRPHKVPPPVAVNIAGIDILDALLGAWKTCKLYIIYSLLPGRSSRRIHTQSIYTHRNHCAGSCEAGVFWNLGSGLVLEFAGLLIDVYSNSAGSVKTNANAFYAYIYIHLCHRG